MHVINFDEPFGFSVVEAMACGTAVIARRPGSMSEIIHDSENGHLVGSVSGAVAALRAADSMDRMAVRKSVEDRLDCNRIVDEYLTVYQRVVELHPTIRAEPGNAG